MPRAHACPARATFSALFARQGWSCCDVEPHTIAVKPHAIGDEPHAIDGDPHAIGDEPHAIDGEPHAIFLDAGSIVAPVGASWMAGS